MNLTTLPESHKRQHFRFRDGYKLSSGRRASSVKSLAARKAHLDASGTRLLAGEANQLFPSAVFSSFKFPASPESTSSMSVGPNPDYMPLWVQKRYGGAAMAGLQIREKCITQQSQSTASSANPPPRFTVEAASAFPILCRNDPALVQMLEPLSTIEKRREHLRTQLKAADSVLMQWERQ